MGKKNKSFYKKQIKPFVKNNTVLLAALSGVAAGVTLTNIMGTEKAKQIVSGVQSSLYNVLGKAKERLQAMRAVGSIPEANHST